jgi:nitrogen fixation protein FixH
MEKLINVFFAIIIAGSLAVTINSLNTLNGLKANQPHIVLAKK